MWKDIIVEEIRQIRKDIEDDCSGDPQKIFQQALEIQNKYSDRIVYRKERAANQFVIPDEQLNLLKQTLHSGVNAG